MSGLATAGLVLYAFGWLLTAGIALKNEGPLWALGTLFVPMVWLYYLVTRRQRLVPAILLVVAGVVLFGLGNGFRTLAGSASEPPPAILASRKEDSGAAMLAMVLAAHGKTASVAELRPAVGSPSNALGIVEGARRYGLAAKGVQASVADLELFAPSDLPAILHWSEEPGSFPVPIERLGSVAARFVLWEGRRSDQFEIVDPVAGRRLASRDEVRQHFTGVLLLFTENEAPAS